MIRRRIEQQVATARPPRDVVEAGDVDRCAHRITTRHATLRESIDMRVTHLITAGLFTLALGGCGGGSNSPRAVPVPPNNNNDGSPVTAIITARFDPTASVIPFPIN